MNFQLTWMLKIHSRSSDGRHAEVFILSGHLVPILNKLNVSGKERFPRIVRVEAGAASETPPEEHDPDGEMELCHALGNSGTVSDDDRAEEGTVIGLTGSDDVGKGVARKFLGESTFRGTITKARTIHRFALLLINVCKIAILISSFSMDVFK